MFLYYVWLRLFVLAWRQHNVKSLMHKVILIVLLHHTTVTWKCWGLVSPLHTIAQMKANHQIFMNMLMKVVHHFIQIIHSIHLFILVVKEDRSSEDDLGCTNEGVLERPNVEDGVFLSNEDPLHPGPRNMLVLVQSCMNTNVNVAPQASEEIWPRRIKMKVRHHRQRVAACKSPFVQYKRLTKEETHVAEYVFDESKDPRLVLNHTFSKYCS